MEPGRYLAKTTEVETGKSITIPVIAHQKSGEIWLEIGRLVPLIRFREIRPDCTFEKIV